MAAGTRQDRGSRSGVLSVANAMARHSDVVLAGGVMMILAMMVLPLPPPLIDLMVATNIAVATSRMVVAMYTKEVLAFSVFPSLLLLVTLFRLAINVSSTRMILLQGDAGQIIASFGHFVVGGSVVVGIVVFLILLVIQFVVITNGAGRVAEVPRASPWTPCPASRCRSMRTSTPVLSLMSRRAGGGARYPTKRISTAPWTAHPSSSKATPSRRSSS